MNFEEALNEAYMELEEASSPMTMKQKQKVKKMKTSGWTISKKEDGKVVMSKGNKEVFVYDSGETFFIAEGEEYNVTDVVETMFDED